MSNLSNYLPQDRRRALSRGETLPDRTTGSALFADISGFTALTEALRQSLGSRRGAEELSRHLDAVYTALIDHVQQYGGSVISFAGDAIICWFDDGDGSAPPRAVACGVALQIATQAFQAITLPDGATTTLALKVAVATGPARRFVVGDPEIQYLDTLAGQTISRMATAEQLARENEVIIDEATAVTLTPDLPIQEWRHADGQRFALISDLSDLAGWQNRPPLAPDLPALDPIQVQAWLHRPIYERELAGYTPFLTEFRPCVALFIRFEGIDYDHDEAQSQLDTFMRQLQTIIQQYEGTLLQLTIGDKGSYVYVNFGALNTHEDDGRRAIKTALALREAARGLPFFVPLQMGITYGVMRTGAYGSVTRRTHSALGDHVNLAARLMQTAAPGEILVSQAGQKAGGTYFHYEPRPALQLKGKSELQTMFAIIGEYQRRAIRLQEPNYALPMVGRQVELQRIAEKLDLAVQGQSQIIGIVAEAGLGKSRLVAEVIRTARQKGFVGYGGACQSDAIHTPYQVWKPIWQAFFDVDPEQPLPEQMGGLKGEIEAYAPSRLNAMPLLNVVLDLNIPPNAFTQSLEPKIRQSALHALLEDCLKVQAANKPTLIVIEDLHWIDALSHDLLEQLARALANYAVCFLLAYRPPQLSRLETPRLEPLPQFTPIELHELTPAEAESVIRAKVAQLYPTRSEALPSGLADMLMGRAQGNPFYLEELLNYVRDRKLDPADIKNIQLPNSLHALILSRIDQLSEQEKITLRVASIVGRLFRAQWLTGYYPALGEFPQVQNTLKELDALDITPLDPSEPELAYLFKHIITYEATYESLPFATRAHLHEQLALYLEEINAPLDSIAHHYGQSDNVAKQREYFQKAADAAEAAFANEAALDYLARLLPLLDEPHAQINCHLQMGEIMRFMGQYHEAEMVFRAAQRLAEQLADTLLLARCQLAIGKVLNLRGNYTEAFRYLQQAQTQFAAGEDHLALARTHMQMGEIDVRQGDYANGRANFEQGLAMAQALNDKALTASVFTALAILAFYQGNYSTAQSLEQQALALYTELGDKPGVATITGNMGTTASLLGDYAGSHALYEQSLALGREIGDKKQVIHAFVNMGLLAHEQGDYTRAQALQEQALALLRQRGSKFVLAITLINLGNLAIEQKDMTMAKATFSESLLLSQEMDDKNNIFYNLSGLAATAALDNDLPRSARLASAAETLRLSLGTAWDRIEERIYNGAVTAAQAGLNEAEFEALWAEGEGMDVDTVVGYALGEATERVDFLQGRYHY